MAGGIGSVNYDANGLVEYHSAGMRACSVIQAEAIALYEALKRTIALGTD